VRDAIQRGRAEWLALFLSITQEEAWRSLPAPDDPDVFARCKLDFTERAKHRTIYDLHIDLLKLRRDDSRFSQQILGGVDGAVVSPASFALRYFSKQNDDRLLIINLGDSKTLKPAPEPLLAPPLSCRWETLWTSESPLYGGTGSIAIASEEQWVLPAETAVALRPVPREK
jgi:maltooligosyltrehalose trehalohydrolase